MGIFKQLLADAVFEDENSLKSLLKQNLQFSVYNYYLEV